MPLFIFNDVPDPDLLPESVVGMAINAPGVHDSGVHTHQRAQLMYIVNGVVQIMINQHRLILPPTMAVWIPAGVKHRLESSKPFFYRSLYFDTSAYVSLSDQSRVLGVNGLLRELIVQITDWPLAKLTARQERLVSVLLDEIAGAPVQPLSLPMPADRRLMTVAAYLLNHPGDTVTLTWLAQQAGASSRTINRLFQEETGLTFSDWRQQLKIMEASKMLAEGESVTQVALALGYTQESAFISMFRKITGHTPGKFKAALIR